MRFPVLIIEDRPIWHSDILYSKAPENRIFRPRVQSVSIFENKNPQLVIFQGYIVFGAFILARIPVSYHPQTYKQYTSYSKTINNAAVNTLQLDRNNLTMPIRSMKRQPNPLFSPLYSRYFSLFKGMACQRKAPIPSKKPRISELRRQAILVMRTIVHQ